MLATIVIILIVSVIFKIMWDNFRPICWELPPGPFRFPILGTLPQIVLADKLYFIAFHKISKKYGEIMTVKLGSLNAVVISNLEAMKEILNKDEAFGRYRSLVFVNRVPDQRKSLVFSNGEAWKEIRTQTTKLLRLHEYYNTNKTEEIIHECIKNFRNNKWDRDIQNNNFTYIELEYFDGMFAQVIISVLTGMLYSKQENITRILKPIQELVQNPITTGVVNFFPYLLTLFPKFFKFDTDRRNIKALNLAAQVFLDEVRQNDQYLTPISFVEEFASRIEKNVDKLDLVFTDEQFRLIFADLVTAGFETTSTTMKFTILHLALNPEFQEKVYQEILQHVGLDRKPCLKDKPKMPWTEATLLECSRLGRIVPVLVPRMAIKTFKYKNYTIPKGYSIMANIHSVLFDEKLWGDPYVFRPERFLNESGELSCNSEYKAVKILFSTGRRSCPGESLAKNSIFLAVSTIIQSYVFEVAPNQPRPSLEPIVGLALHPQPYYLKVKRREL